MKAVCVLSGSSDFRYRGVRFVEPSEEAQEFVTKAIRDFYASETDFEALTEEVRGAEHFFIDPAVVERLQKVEFPSVGSDQANDALGELMINVCRAFEVEPEIETVRPTCPICGCETIVYVANNELIYKVNSARVGEYEGETVLEADDLDLVDTKEAGSIYRCTGTGCTFVSGDLIDFNPN